MQADFDCIFYYVSDLDRAIQFYTDVLGFKLHSRDVVARLHVGNVLFELVPAPDSRALQGGGNGRLCLRVDDIRAAVAELRSKGVPTENPESKSNGLLSSLHDPDGNEICLWEYTS